MLKILEQNKTMEFYKQKYLKFQKNKEFWKKILRIVSNYKYKS